jgi:hypothetical protein
VTLIDRVAGALERRTSRRGFLMRTAVVGSALAVDPIDYVLHPGTAYAAVCRCGSGGCGCGSACCDGYTEFCCTLTGSNTCPPGTFAGGWWRADGSAFCSGPRYYTDCHSECPTQNGPGFCVGQESIPCGCAQGNCNNRVSGCITFRYGQCHQEIATAGRIACRVVTCTPAYLLDNACTTQALFDDNTANQNRACLQAPAVRRRAYASASAVSGQAVWLASAGGAVYAFGQAAYHGGVGDLSLTAPITGMAAIATASGSGSGSGTASASASASGDGYWLVGADGGVFAFGSAAFHGSMGGRRLNAPIVGIAATPDGSGYWLVASDGGIFAFGTAAFHGSTGALTLDQPIVGMTASPAGAGYWLVASDGGIFAFGTASFHGSTGGAALDSLIGGLVATATGAGYWLWGEDGSVYPFGDATGLGDYPGLPATERTLPSAGVDAFYAMTVGEGGYTLWGVSPLGPPPTARPYTFTGAVPVAPSPPSPSPSPSPAPSPPGLKL